MSNETKNGLERGTPGYAIKFFNRDILVNLQLDLKRLERKGIDESICDKVQLLLSALVSAASAEAKGTFWWHPIHSVLRTYEKTYIASMSYPLLTDNRNNSKLGGAVLTLTLHDYIKKTFIK